VPELLVGAFSPDPAVIETGGTLFRVAAAFQLFDGLQAVATGVLRGTGDTRTAMAANLAGHWLVGLPLGSALAFHLGLGVVGMWMGLSLGLILIGSFLLAIWTRRARGLRGTRVFDHSAPVPAT
jgi:multidrug resistance protein, MATE family